MLEQRSEVLRRAVQVALGSIVGIGVCQNVPGNLAGQVAIRDPDDDGLALGVVGDGVEQKLVHRLDAGLEVGVVETL